MSIIFKKILLMVFAFALFIIGYEVGSYKETTYKKEDEIIKETTDACPYVVKGDKKYYGLYFDHETSVVTEPKFIDNPQIIKIKKPFNLKEFEKKLYKYSSNDKGWSSEEFDVDGDGNKETIISGNIAMNHTPHIAMIVKENNVIFEAENANIWIEEISNSNGNGFILHETVEFGWYPYKKELTRYVYKDGVFIPIWKQTECSVDFN